MPTTRQSALLFAALASACATQTSIVKQALAKPYPCDLQVFRSEKEITRPFEQLCVIAVDETAIWANEDASLGVTEKTRKAACKCGADGLIIRATSGGKRQARIDSIAIRFTGQPPEVKPY